jgi:multiple sugar transport system substrate-binding protein
MSRPNNLRTPFNRRRLLRTIGIAGAALAAGGPMFDRAASATTTISVLCPTPPDPAPPGFAPFSTETVTAWQVKNDASINYEPIDWPRIHDRLSIYFSAGTPIYDVIYSAGWVQEFYEGLEALGPLLPKTLKADIPSASFATNSWNGEIYGCSSTLSLLTLYTNTEHLVAAGLTKPPATWDELKGYAQELTRDGRYGWTQNYGTPNGIGGTTSYWMAFLQQAGGTMYDDKGRPIFNDAPGVDALQLMIDLMPSTHPDALTDVSINDSSNVFGSGGASMMMNWPFMWQTLQTAETSTVSGRIATSVLPSGPAGSASIDGADAWTITSTSEHPELAMKLIELYVDRSVQREQAIETGWLPIRRSVLEEKELQDALPHASTVLAQSEFPYSSFLTPDYDAITSALGIEIQLALAGKKTAAQALADASKVVNRIVNQRNTK